MTNSSEGSMRGIHPTTKTITIVTTTTTTITLKVDEKATGNKSGQIRSENGGVIATRTFSIDLFILVTL